ncbi:HAMP domain-containing protein [Salinispira pacifica]|uniref:Phosphate regulon sensor protein PhoR (SphS) n=1 Tax=Salinispira pacifica TaxID=1307761 RepID=V5WGE2_9SPIO|nr:HAMP domain-containing protein [Salinispira pacifica]AHC14690.1 Phosphate regulon sensor protein PhoR (SphS) [Salinispira pacifica]
MLYGFGRTQGLRRSFIILPLITLLSMVLISIFLTGVIRSNTLRETRRILEASAQFFSAAFLTEFQDREGNSPDWAQDYTSKLADQADIRITVIQEDGTVIADNWAQPSEMDNHALRPEISSALLGREDHTTRYSSTLNADLMYFARPLAPPSEFSGEQLVIRTASRLTQTEELLANSYRVIAIISGIIISLSIIVIITQLRAIQKPLSKILSAAEDIERGEWELDLYILRPYEFASIARAMKKMAKALKHQITDLNRQREELQRVFNLQKDVVMVLDRHQIIIQHNIPAARFLMKRESELHDSDFREDTLLDASTRRLTGSSMLSYVRSSELNRIFEEARDSGRLSRGRFTLYTDTAEHFECYITPITRFSRDHSISRNRQDGNQDQEDYLLVIYR